MDGPNNDAPVGPPRLPVLERVPVGEFAAKFDSKSECYKFLTIECDAHLPPFSKSSSPFSLIV